MTAAAARLRQLRDNATPGRWIVGTTNAGYRVIYADDALPPETARPQVTQLRGKNRKSDARLIALAPELALLAADMADWIDSELYDTEASTEEGAALLTRLDTLTAGGSSA